RRLADRSPGNEVHDGARLLPRTPGVDIRAQRVRARRGGSRSGASSHLRRAVPRRRVRPVARHLPAHRRGSPAPRRAGPRAGLHGNRPAAGTSRRRAARLRHDDTARRGGGSRLARHVRSDGITRRRPSERAPFDTWGDTLRSSSSRRGRCDGNGGGAPRGVTMDDTDNLATARRYVAALSSGAGADEIGRFYAPDVVQEEFPNRLMPNGATRDLEAMRQARLRGKALLSAEAFELHSAVASGDQVAMELTWRGTIGVSGGPFT